MTRLEKAKDVIKKNFESFSCGIFDCRNVVGDAMMTLYVDDDIKIDVCPGWSYFEVFGLTNDEFSELKDFYEALLKEIK